MHEEAEGKGTKHDYSNKVETKKWYKWLTFNTNCAQRYDEDYLEG
jgi:hypothetical protein